MADTDKILSERGDRYGDFLGHSKYTQSLKRILQSSPNWATMEDDQREGLEMVMHKVGRILNGDPNYADSWTDIAGYAKLVENRLEGKRIPNVTVPATPSIPGVIEPKGVLSQVSPPVGAPDATSAQKPAAPSPISPIGAETKK